MLIVGRIHNAATLVIGALVFIIATIGINIVANFVSPAYDLANVAPKHISFQRGGLISAVLAFVVLPWKLYSSPVAVNYFLGGLGAFLGPLFAIIMVDYYLIRHERVSMPDLYREAVAATTTSTGSTPGRSRPSSLRPRSRGGGGTRLCL